MASLASRALALALTALALVLYSSRMPGALARSERTWCDNCNIILISFDTVRADHLGIYGYERDTSPNIDRFAEHAVVFDQAIAQSSWTLPAHGSIMSGLYGGRLGVLHYPATHRLPVTNPVLAETLEAAGYATAGFTGGGFVSDHYGFARGFDVYSTSGRHFEHNIDQAIEWVRSKKDKPFFLFFHGYDAHRPYYSKPVDKEALGLQPSDATEQGRYCLREDRTRPDPAHLDEIVRYYDAAIHHGDRTLGIFLRAIKQLELMDNTVILLTSDHGEEFFEHGSCDHVRFLYRESVQVPFILYVPRMTRSTRRVTGLVPASISVARTLLDLVGVEHSMPGVTLLPIIEGTQRDFPVVYSEADSDPGTLGSRGSCRAITRPGQKLISYSDEGSDEGYDLKTDVLETKVLPEKHPVYELRNTLRAFADAQTPLSQTPDADLDEEDAAGTAGDSRSGGERGNSDGGVPGGGGTKGGGETQLRGVDGGAPGAKPGAMPGGADRPAPDAPAPVAPAAPDAPVAPAAPDATKQDGLEVPKDVRDSLRSLGYLE